MLPEHAVERRNVSGVEVGELAPVHVGQHFIVFLHRDAPAQVQIVQLRDERADIPRLLPASWITAANQTLVRVVSLRTVRSTPACITDRALPGRDVTVGARQIHLPKGQATVMVGLDDPSVAMHEYTHHLQAAMPELDGLFQALHRRRTHDEPVIELPGYPGIRGRKDQYIDAYFGLSILVLRRRPWR